ncbi:MAG: glycosyltransferase family 2 protein [Devosia sp.]
MTIDDTSQAPRIAVLLGTFNGARFLDEQLQSLADQKVARLDIYASDDGSGDDTLAILARWKAAWRKGVFEISAGPGKGFSENFRSLVLSAGERADADFIAFCDQDDIWDADKLTAAVGALSGAAGRPAVYFSRTRLIDAKGRPFGISPLFRRQPGFRNAVVQSIGGGNTMVLNAKGLALFAQSARRTSFVAHDWWGYIIVSGAGGFVHYDPEPHVDYRQHEANSVGSNVGMRARLKRLGRQFDGAFAGWNTTNTTALGKCLDLLSPEARTVLAEFTAMRRKRSLAGVRQFLHSGIRRQTVQGNIALAIAVALGMT